MKPESQQVTQILHRWTDGDEHALDDLIPLLYQELKHLASVQLRRDQKASIQCTELVAEAYMKLVDAKQIDWQSRNHFYAIAAKTMRRVLVERYRKHQAEKRGSGQTMLTFHDDSTGSEQSAVPLNDLDEALQQLELLDARQAEIVTLKFFGGLEGEEIGSLLNISSRTVKREWAAARLWLFRQMNQGQST